MTTLYTPPTGTLLPPVSDPVFTPPSGAAGSDPSTLAPASGSSSAGSLSLNLGGLNLSYDLGPSVSQVSAQTLPWLSSQFSADSAFVGQTIMGAQTWMAGMVSPVLGAAVATQQTTNVSLPQMYNQLLANNFSLGQQSIAAQTATANASIASSNASAAAAGSGGCYITTAVCRADGLPDDCDTLSTLRRFRDTYMRATALRRKQVARYYRDAPRWAAAIERRPDAAAVLAWLRDRYILPACRAIKAGHTARAAMLYIHAVQAAQLLAMGADTMPADRIVA
jgi:hypothetical protein